MSRAAAADSGRAGSGRRGSGQLPPAESAATGGPASASDTDLLQAVMLSDASGRLRNSIAEAGRSGRLAAMTVGDYVESYPESEAALLASVRNFGERSAAELREVVWKFLAAGAAADPGDSGAGAGPGLALALRLGVAPPPGYRHARHYAASVLHALPFPGCLYDFPLSGRLTRALDSFGYLHGPQCPTLADFLADRRRWLPLLARQEGFGSVTGEALAARLADILSGIFLQRGLSGEEAATVADWLVRSDAETAPAGLDDSLWMRLHAGAGEASPAAGAAPPLSAGTQSVVHGIARRPAAALEAFLRGLLNEQQYAVIGSRFGFCGVRRRTQSAIAADHGLTRERIRQIGLRAMDRCQAPAHREIFRTYLETQRDEILRALAHGNPFISRFEADRWREHLAGLQQLAIAVLHGDAATWLDAGLDAWTQDGTPAGWFMPDTRPDCRRQLERRLSNSDFYGNNLRQLLIDTVHGAHWPLTVADLQERVPAIPGYRLERALREELGAVITDGRILSIAGLPPATRLVLVLHAAGRPLHLSEVCARHARMFGNDIGERAAGSLLQRIDEAIIVDRGTYGLFENLPLDSGAVETLRDSSVVHLDRGGRFISAKILQQRVIRKLPADMRRHLTPYMLHGICKGDARFVVRRGLMVGLARPDFQHAFTSLAETVRQLVQDFGPVSIDWIQERISGERAVDDNAVRQILAGAPDIVAAGDGRYDMAGRVIGDAARMRRLACAVQLALIGGATDLATLSERLAAVRLPFAPATVSSYLQTADFVTGPESGLQLESVDPGIAEYDRIFRRHYDPSRSGEENLGVLRRLLRDGDHAMLVELDYRLVTEAPARRRTLAATAPAAVLRGRGDR